MKLPGYRLGAELLHTEHTAVYRGVRESDGLHLVIKTLSREYPLPSEVRRLEFEYRMLEKLRGPGVIATLGMTRTGGQLALLLEDFGGITLGERPMPLPLAAFFRVAKQAVAALGHVHGHDVVHKDIKPHNILVTPDLSKLALIEFELASEISRERQDVSVMNRLEGSLAYISPEQTGRMNRALDYRSDYYSLGVTFFELLTGQLPLVASDVMGWVSCHISKPPPEAREVSPQVPLMLSRLIAKLLAKDPGERYQSARGLLADLERCEALSHAGRHDEEFELGELDVSERFTLSQHLVGREDEARLSRAVLESACSGAGKLLVVSGYSGIGKSSLIREVHGPLASRRGYFASGKFDQLDRSIPYAGLVEALRHLMRQLLSEPDSQVQRWRNHILGELGANASVMAELVPELATVIGPQPPPPPLDPSSAQNRFKFVFTRFIQVLATAEHPLVLFIDDLQWADASTPDLIADLFINHQPRHLLVIGAYRDNEVAAAHLLAVALGKLRQSAPRSLVELSLSPLTESGVGEIVAGALKCEPHHCAPLAREIYRKTQGNPFFTSELLSTLHREGAITFNASLGTWSWDLDAARRLTASQNVVDLLVTRLGRLHPDVLFALQMAACVGNVFSLSTLASLLERSPDATAALLSAPIAEGLIVPLDDTYKLMQLGAEDAERHAALEVRYRFQHDRVQQATYSLIADGDKAATHLRIGRRLLAAEPDAEHPADLFSVTNHLNMGRALMTELGEREMLARLNRKAGAKALAATAFTVAAKYHEAGVSCLSRAEWAEQKELRFALFSERVGSVLMAGERERAAALCKDLLELAPTRAAHAAVYLIQSQVMMYQGKLVEAIASVRSGLRTLGIDFPEDPATIEQQIGAGIGKMQEHLARVPIEELAHLPEVADAEKLVALQLLFHVIGAAIMVYPPLFILAELITFDLALSHGTTAVCAKNFVDCGMIQGGALGNYAAAYRLGKVAFRVVERYDARALAGQVHFVFAAYVSPWGAPYAESLRSFEEARRLEIEAGDHNHLGFSEALHLRMLLNLGRHLEECLAAADDITILMDRIQAMVAIGGVRLISHAIAQLRQQTSLTPKEARLSAPVTRELLASGNAQYAFQHGQAQMLVHGLLGDWEGASEFWDFAREREMAASTLFTVPEYVLFGCLITTQWRWARTPDAERPALLAELERGVDKLRGWAEGCPENFAHKHLLAAAELARVRGEPAESVTRLFESAIEAMGQQFLHLCALAHELLGRYWLGLGQRRVGEPLLREALSLYGLWGATAKVSRLEAELDASGRRRRDTRARSHEGADGPRPSERSLYSRAIDLGSVLKAQRAISGEVKSERLYAALMAAILENAGAEHGCLVLCDDDQALRVRARADQRGDREVAVNHTLESEPRACHQIIRYVARSLDPLVIDDAMAHETFGQDPYIARHRVKSVLCMPIIHGGRLVAVLYVENDATTFAFTADRVETLRLIAGQAAISITNASLYESLERKVEERTRELAAKTRKMSAMLDGIEQGVFTLDDELRVQPEHSRYLEQLSGQREVVGRDVSEVLFAGSDRSDAEIATNESALRFSFGAPLAIARLNADHLIKSYTRPGPDGSPRHYEVDWSWITDDDGKVERVLVAARDVTRVRGLEQAAAEAAREKEMLAQILDAGLEDFKSFAETSRRLLEQHLAAAHRGLSPERRRALFRDVHTIKGHARTLGLIPLVTAAHAAETACPPEGEDHVGADGIGVDALRALVDLIAEHERIGERKLGRLWSGADARFRQALGAIESALAQTPNRPSYPVRALSEVQRAVHRLNAVPLDQVLRETSRVCPSLARELGKADPEIEWKDDGTLLDAEWGRLMKDALVHTFRNSMDHGIETSEERAAAGKAPRGKIALYTERDAHGVRIHLADDGRGLPLAELRAKTGRADSPDRDVAEAIFDYGVSTSRRLSQVSGRGIGMDAVRAFLRERGGDVVIEFTGEAREGYRPFELVFRLPGSATLGP